MDLLEMGRESAHHDVHRMEASHLQQVAPAGQPGHVQGAATTFSDHLSGTRVKRPTLLVTLVGRPNHRPAHRRVGVHPHLGATASGSSMELVSGQTVKQVPSMAASPPHTV